MEQDYLSKVRDNFARAAALKAAERKEEARQTRSAKILLVSFLLIVGVLIVLFGDNVANWA